MVINMKRIYKFSLVALLFLSACTTTNLKPSNPVQVAQESPTTVSSHPIHSMEVAKQLNDCIVRSNQSADAILVDSQIIVVTRNNPHAGILFTSSDKLSDQQAKALTNYLAESNKCRPIATEGLSEPMLKVYYNFFNKLDQVYADLIARKITIGVANQERQLLIQDARLKRLAIQSKQSE